MRLPFLAPRSFMAVSSPDSTSPALIGLAGLAAGSACCAEAAGAASASVIAAKARRPANRRFVIPMVPYVMIRRESAAAWQPIAYLHRDNQARRRPARHAPAASP